MNYIFLIATSLLAVIEPINDGGEAQIPLDENLRKRAGKTNNFFSFGFGFI